MNLSIYIAVAYYVSKGNLAQVVSEESESAINPEISVRPPTSKVPMLPLSHWFPLFSFLFFSFLLLLFFSSNLSPICSSLLPPSTTPTLPALPPHPHLHPTSSRLTTPTLMTPFFSLFLHFSPSFLLTNSPRPHPLKKHIATCPPLPFLSFTILTNLYLY